MALIKSTSARVENEQTRKLHELGANNVTATSRNEFMSFGGPSTMNGLDSTNGGDDTNFEALVRGGNPGPSGGSDMLGGDPWANGSASGSTSTTLPLHSATNRARTASPAATFAWSTPPVSPPPATNLSTAPQGQKAATSNSSFSALNSSFPAMSPLNPGIGSPTFGQQNSRPGMSMNSMASSPAMTPNYTPQPASIDWSKASTSSSMTNNWSNTSSNATSTLSSFPSLTPQAPSQPQMQSQSQNNPYSSFSIAPPKMSSFSIAPPPPPPSNSNMGMGMGMGMGNRSTSAGTGVSMASLRAQTQRQQGQSGSANQNQSQGAGWGSGGDSLI
jgi:SCY1-like protein 2